MYPYNSYHPYAWAGSEDQNSAVQDLHNECSQHCGRLSARNQLTGTVVKVTEGAVNLIVVIDIGCDNYITSVITMDSLEDLGIHIGSAVTAVIKSSDVILMV